MFTAVLTNLNFDSVALSSGHSVDFIFFFFFFCLNSSACRRTSSLDDLLQGTLNPELDDKNM